VIPDGWRRGEVAVIGLARTGAAASRWLALQGVSIYASDAATAGLEATARALGAMGVVVELGRHDLERIARATVVIASPGVPPDAEPLAAARRAGVPVRSEIDLAAQALPATRLVAITGTNGKSTVTAMIAHLMEQGGIPCPAAGNIGRPLIALALDAPPPPWAAVEVSSFQLHDSPSLRPAVGVLTNLAPDHLDRYPSVAAYYEDKRLLFRNAATDSLWVLNGDDSAVLDLARGAAGARRTWRLAGAADAWLDRPAATLMLDGAPLLARGDLPLLGDHNVANALAASLAVRAAGLPPDAIRAGLGTFHGLPHRLEIVRTVDGVVWINDSKATNVASTAVGARAMDRPFVLILGGRHKGEPYTSLTPILAGRCRYVLAYGESAPLVVADLGRALPVTRVRTLEEAVADARRHAAAGDAVLLSPACSSFDQFKNYEERGATFRALVDAL
jgi:UDP-N-acetylmuramoylalanine--D-glutamate ligase